MDLTPLDRFILDANALDVYARTATPLADVTEHAVVAWHNRTEADRELIRELYRPAYFRLVVSILEDAAHLLGDHSDAAARIRNHADRYRP